MTDFSNTLSNLYIKILAKTVELVFCIIDSWTWTIFWFISMRFYVIYSFIGNHMYNVRYDIETVEIYFEIRLIIIWFNWSKNYHLMKIYHLLALGFNQPEMRNTIQGKNGNNCSSMIIYNYANDENRFAQSNQSQESAFIRFHHRFHLRLKTLYSSQWTFKPNFRYEQMKIGKWKFCWEKLAHFINTNNYLFVRIKWKNSSFFHFSFE